MHGPELLKQLEAMGHAVRVSTDKQGDAHSIWIDRKTGELIGVADKRENGLRGRILSRHRLSSRWICRLIPSHRPAPSEAAGDLFLPSGKGSPSPAGILFCSRRGSFPRHAHRFPS